jgi:hypothetical protein
MSSILQPNPGQKTKTSMPQLVARNQMKPYVFRRPQKFKASEKWGAIFLRQEPGKESKQ